MKSKLLFLFVIGLFPLTSHAQNDSLNQLDSLGKRNGKWAVYWNSNWEEVKDSESATFIRYTFYDHGMNVYPMGPRGKKWKMVATDTLPHLNKSKVLNGEYKWYDESGNLRATDVFKNGEYVSYEWFYPTGEIQQFFDYTKHWNDQRLSWYVIEYKKSGTIMRETFINAKGYGEKSK